MKKVLILTVTAGNGHNSAAYSMKDALEKAGNEVKVVDIFKDSGQKFVAWEQNKGYLISIRYLRGTYNFFYNKYKRNDYRNKPNCFCQKLVKKIHGFLLKTIYQFQPDVIYATHYACGTALANLRLVYKLPSVNIACMLDYVVSPFWETTAGGLDFLTITNEEFRSELIEEGFENKKLICTGLPVSEKFLTEIDKEVAREKLGLKQNVFTILIMFGGGIGGSYKVLKWLLKRIKKDVQIVVVNGKNEKIKKKIDREMAKYPKNFFIKNIGFSKEVDLIMSACDCMIGKGGGLSTTESINKCLPLVTTKKLPSQEIYNIKFLEDKRLCLSFKNRKDLARKINFLMDNPEERNKIKSGLKKLRTNAFAQIFDLISSQPYADYFDINIHLNYANVNKVVKHALKEKKN